MPISVNLNSMPTKASAVRIVTRALLALVLLGSNVHSEPGLASPTSSGSDATLARTGSDAATRSDATLVLEPQSMFLTVAVSPDGQNILTGGYYDVQLWDARTRKLVRTFEGNKRDIQCVTFSPDGQLVASSGLDGCVRIWESRTGKPTQVFRQGMVDWIGFSSDGGTLATSVSTSTANSKGAWEFDFGMAISFWDVRTGKLNRTVSVKLRQVEPFAISRDLKILATGRSDEIKLWSLDDGKELRSINNPYALKAIGKSSEQKSTGSNKSAELRCLAFNSVGSLLAGGGADGIVRIWNLKTGTIARSFKADLTSIGSIVFQPDSMNMAVFGSDKTLNLWNGSNGNKLWNLASNLETSDPRLTFNSAGDCVACLVPRIKHVKDLATGKDIKIVGENVQVWKVADRKEYCILDNPIRKIESFDATGDGKTFITRNEDNSLRVWGARNGRKPLVASKTCGMVALHPSESIIASAAGSAVTIIDPSIQPSAVLGGQAGQVKAMLFSHDGKTLVISREGSTMELWNLVDSGGSYKAVLRHTISVGSTSTSAIAFNLTDTIFATAGSDGQINFWGPRSGERVLRVTGSGKEINSLTFSPDGKMLAAGSNLTVRLFDASTLTEVRTLFFRDYVVTGGDLHKIYDAEGALGAMPLLVSYSPDGSYLSASDETRTKIWNTRTGELYKTLQYGFCKFLPDGKTIVSRPRTGSSLAILDFPSSKILGFVTAFDENSFAVVSPDGHFDATSLSSIEGLSWTIPSQPMRGLPIEIFFKQYYTPNLLQDILSREALPAVPSLSGLNLLQPEVEITSIVPASGASHKSSKGAESDLVEVTVACASTSADSPDSNGPDKQSGAVDLRLFRDGQLVGHIAKPLDSTSKNPVSNSKNPASIGDVRQHKFLVRLPHNGASSYDFTAYAFNNDDVKSITASQRYTLGHPLELKRGRAYVIAFGANRYDDPGWNLKWAAADARAFVTDLVPVLQARNSFSKVVAVPLISDDKAADNQLPATKEAISDVFRVLSGRQPKNLQTASLLKNLDVMKAQPEDFVFISFACHGVTDEETNEYFLFPSDIGANQNKGLVSELKAHAIGTRELGELVEDIDAGDIAVVIDACYSGAVSGKDTRGGPMNNAGLAQLAYFKGLRVLSASKATSTAQETNELGHGLLTFALLKEGLRSDQADSQPRDGKIALQELLSFAVEEVPRLDAQRGLSKRGVKVKNMVRSDVERQVPQLFDFNNRFENDLILMDVRSEKTGN